MVRMRYHQGGYINQRTVSLKVTAAYLGTGAGVDMTIPDLPVSSWH